MWLRFAYGFVRPIIARWVSTRALVLPAAKVDMLAKKYGVSPSAITDLDNLVIDSLLTKLDEAVATGKF